MNLMIDMKNTTRHKITISKDRVAYKPAHNTIDKDIFEFVKEIGEKLANTHPFTLRGFIDRRDNYLFMDINNERGTNPLTFDKETK